MWKLKPRSHKISRITTIVQSIFIISLLGADASCGSRGVENGAAPATIAASSQPVCSHLLTSIKAAARVLGSICPAERDREHIRVFIKLAKTGQNQTASFGETH
jgi:hypothetical protein